MPIVPPTWMITYSSTSGTTMKIAIRSRGTGEGYPGVPSGP